ncbi:hypothetical protein CN683_25195 [Bacillus toyonensis]|uniref:Uncharacterized protein n=1 Tax=Bacillus toyonensis TaxID=155322 RepID=A0AB36SG55_9BACI|nr:hypothetical protein CN683_25195 [Bacillus toyonensis]PEN46476.1 hypothetical protein CN596_28405 [Bacillus toyonensis]PGC86423.1 hypothetical protein COM29_16945 [Bacillus toyonensis]
MVILTSLYRTNCDYYRIPKCTWNYLTKKGSVSLYDTLPFLSFYLPGSKTPTSKLSESEEVKWGMGTPH